MVAQQNFQKRADYLHVYMLMNERGDGEGNGTEII